MKAIQRYDLSLRDELADQWADTVHCSTSLSAARKMLPWLEQKLRDHEAATVERCAAKADSFQGYADLADESIGIEPMGKRIGKALRALSPDPEWSKNVKELAFQEGRLFGVTQTMTDPALRKAREQELERKLLEARRKEADWWHIECEGFLSKKGAIQSRERIADLGRQLAGMEKQK